DLGTVQAGLQSSALAKIYGMVDHVDTVGRLPAGNLFKDPGEFRATAIVDDNNRSGSEIEQTCDQHRQRITGLIGGDYDRHISVGRSHLQGSNLAAMRGCASPRISMESMSITCPVAAEACRP